MRRLFCAMGLLSSLVLAGTTAQAQGLIPVSVEVRGAAALPQGDWNDSDALSTGFGYGFGIQVRVLPLLSLYGGWDTHSFDIDEIEGGDANDSGMHVGAQVMLPLSAVARISPFAFGGAVFNRTSMGIERNGVGVEVESDREVGYEFGAGIAFPFAPGASLAPQARYRSHKADFPDGAGGNNDTTVSYLSLELGVRLGI